MTSAEAANYLAQLKQRAFDQYGSGDAIPRGYREIAREDALNQLDPGADSTPVGLAYQQLFPNGWEYTAPTNTSGGGTSSSGGTTRPVLNQAAVDATQAAINSLDTELGTGYGNIEGSYGSLIGKYDVEKSRNKEDFDEQTFTNTTNLGKNKQNALLAAAQGRRGLRGTLASLGALSGTGSELADRAVTTEANQDLGEATETYGGNARQLGKAWDRFSEEDEDRRREATTARENQRTALEGSVLSKRQQFYQKMADLFAEAGNTGEASNWLNMAGGLNEGIAARTRVGATPFTARTAAFTPGDLENYLAGAGDLRVNVGPGGTGARTPSSIFAGRSRKRREEEEAAPV